MMRGERQITQHIRYGYALPFGTLLPSVATSYMLKPLYDIPVKIESKTYGGREE